MKLTLTIEPDPRRQGRWIAAIPEIADAVVCGESEEEAIRKVVVLALRTIAEQVEQGERLPAVDHPIGAGWPISLPDVTFEYAFGTQ